MGEKSLEINTPSGEIFASFPKYEEVQKASWDVLEHFNQTASVDTALGRKYEKFDSMSLFQLRDALFQDSQKKHKGFMAMYNSVNELLNLSGSSGRCFDEDGNGMTKDFFETLFTAVTSVNQYLATHSGYRWLEKGERRVQIATRISYLLKELTNEVLRVQSALPEKKARMVNYAKEGLSDEEIQERERLLLIDSHSEELIRMTETGEFGPKVSSANDKEAAKKWIINGYSAELKKLLENGGVLDGTAETRDDFAAYITDQNNRLLANRMAISIIIDDDKEATLGMPWIKSELYEYLLKNIDNEKMLTKTTEFAQLVRNTVENFKRDNKEKLSFQKKRRDMIESALNVSETSHDLFSYSLIKELITEPDDEIFKEKLEDISERVKATDRLIKSYLNEHFSEATRDYVAEKLIRFSGVYRVAASPSQIMNQVEVFCDMIKYTAPNEYILENIIINMMKDLRIDMVRRDHFVSFISEDKPKKLVRVPIEQLREKAEKYADNVKENSKSFAKCVDTKGCYLSWAQWDELENINLMSGAMKNSEFKAKLIAVLEAQSPGQKLSRNEYLTERKFMDAQNEPERIRRAEHERELIKNLGAGMKQKFMLILSGNGENAYADYIKLDAAYKGTGDKLKKQQEAEEELFAEREAYVKHALQRGGVPRNLWQYYVRKLDYCLKGLLEVTSDMTDDERLYAERKNLENFGVKNLDKVIELIEQVGPELANASMRPDGTIDDIEALTRVRVKYDKGFDILKTYDGEKYAEIADFMVNIPEVFNAMMESTAEEFSAFISKKVDAKLDAFIDGLRLAGKKNDTRENNSDRNIIPGAVLRQYAYSYIRDIYDGSLTGNAAFFKSQLEGYNEKVFKIKPDGSRSIADNIRDAEKVIDKELNKLGKGGSEALGLRLAVLTKIYDMANDTKEFQKLMDNEFLSEFVKDELEKVIGSVKDDQFSDKLKDRIVKAFTDNLPSTDEATARKKEKIRKTRESGAGARTVYLGMNTGQIADIRLGKSLVRVAEKGIRRIKLGSSMADDMRGRIQKYCSSFDLPPVLVDALVEEGSSEAFTDRVRGIMWDSDLLQMHAFSMNKLNSMLMQEFKDDTAMSAEEAQMYIIRLYGSPETRQLFEKEGGPDVAALRTGSEYRLFRKNYEKLTLLEGEESGDPLIERERMEQSKNLRTMLITGVGVLDKRGNTIDSTLYTSEEERCALLESMGDIIDRNKRYLDYSVRLSELIRRQLETEKKDKNVDYSDRYRDLKIIAIRNFLMKDFIKTLDSDEGFDEQTWADKLERIYSDPDLWENIVFDRNSVTEETYRQAEEKKLEHEATEETIANVIDGSAYLFRDRANSYKRLDEDQKKLFALGLVVMDKGAIGYGTQGSMALIHAQAGKAKELGKIRKVLDKYVSGQPIDPVIDYKEALDKLLNYGETNVFYMEGYTLSTTAYDKALSFVNALTAKKIAFMAKDYEKLGFGYESINTAFVKYGKEKQLNEVDKLRDETITIEDVRTKLIEYVGIDTRGVKELGMDIIESGITSPVTVAALDRYAAHRLKMSRIKKRLQGMTPRDIKIFVRIMQERSVIDESRANTGDGEKLYVDQDKRSAPISGSDDSVSIRA
ncbi:MAG: hypothetical protein K6E91_06915, partial [Butyrivibrio sp.]|nr:hypothetical protein [Butyrivibrio sp.]